MKNYEYDTIDVTIYGTDRLQAWAESMRETLLEMEDEETLSLEHAFIECRCNMYRWTEEERGPEPASATYEVTLYCGAYVLHYDVQIDEHGVDCMFRKVDDEVIDLSEWF